MKSKILSLLIMIFTVFAASAADKLAIAEPVGKGGIRARDIDAVWSMLEASVDGGFELISRSALKQMMTEIGLTTSSDLVDLNSSQKAKLGQIKTVKYLLISTVSKMGSRLNVSLMVLDTSTGEISPAMKCSETVDSLDEFADKLPDMLNEIGLGRGAKNRGRSAMLAPIIKVAKAPGYLGEDFNVNLENELLNGGIKLQNLQSVSAILSKNKIGSLDTVEPAMYVRIGGLLRVDYLIQVTLNRFSCTVKKEHIKLTNRYEHKVLGNIEGFVRIISAQTGEIVGSIPFRQRVEFDDLEDTDDWTSEDYGKYLIERIVPDIAKKVVSKIQSEN